MLLLHQRTNQHLQLVTQTRTRLVREVMMLIQTLLMTRVLNLMKSTFMHLMGHKI